MFRKKEVKTNHVLRLFLKNFCFVKLSCDFFMHFCCKSTSKYASFRFFHFFHIFLHKFFACLYILLCNNFFVPVDSMINAYSPRLKPLTISQGVYNYIVEEPPNQPSYHLLNKCKVPATSRR